MQDSTSTLPIDATVPVVSSTTPINKIEVIFVGDSPSPGSPNYNRYGKALEVIERFIRTSAHFAGWDRVLVWTRDSVKCSGRGYDPEYTYYVEMIKSKSTSYGHLDSESVVFLSEHRGSPFTALGIWGMTKRIEKGEQIIA